MDLHLIVSRIIVGFLPLAERCKEVKCADDWMIQSVNESSPNMSQMDRFGQKETLHSNNLSQNSW